MSNPGNKLYVNELIHETSPYLLQHAHNPVDWYPWGEAALGKAWAEDKPIFLSIGYSACHWCHVMERESFENEAIAAYLNANFVSIKVDREERPDLDDIYMAAVLALNGHGGWPMTVFLTPELQPFYGGTYYPPQDVYGRPGFYSVLHGVLNAWQERRDEVLKSAGNLTAYVNAQLSTLAESGEGVDVPGPEVLVQAVADLKGQYDATWGGWGGAPKFPSGMTVGLLLREYRRTGDWQALDMATHTLDRMAAGGMYDQLGGGFSRYSVDEEWLVPHFEKMLYDNAQLSQAYLEAYQLKGTPRYAQVARETLEYVLRDLRDAGGAFHSAEDADSEGEEGKFYLWRKEELIDLLGSQEAVLFGRYYGVRDGGNFSSHEHYHAGLNILHLPQPPEVLAAELGIAPEALEERIAPMRATLLAARGKRVRPGLDDKVLTSWNGLMISSFCLGAQVLGDARYATAAEEAARFLLEQQWREGTLLRTHRRGESRLPGYLDDYAFFANALVDVYETTFNQDWLDAAVEIVDAMLAKFWDKATGAFFFTGEEHKHLITRARPSYDGAEPSGNSVAVLALLRLGALLDRRDYTARARRVLCACAPLLERAPRGYLKLCWGLHWLHAAPLEIVVAAGQGVDAGPALQVLRRAFIPNKVVALAPGTLPLLEGKTAGEVGVRVYVCRDYVCGRPLEGMAAIGAYVAEMGEGN
jgi:uncharacterized protein YyaL (SSP411 family)